jgi:hypothetical protein
MIRKLKSGGYRLYSRKKDAKTGRRRNLGIQDARGGAKTRARGAVFQARRQITAERVEWAFWENWSAIVKPDLRGRGYGLRIWQAGMKRLGSRVIGLDGVTTQQDNYQKSGFVLAHRNIRFGGTPRACNSSGCKTHSNRLRVGAADSRLRSSLLSR